MSEEKVQKAVDYLASHRVRIMVVDDDPGNLKVASLFLKDFDWDIHLYKDELAALKELETSSYDLVIVDIMMPRMDGFELISRVKSLPEYRDVPCIFVTSKTDKKTIVRAFEAGASDYITKPFFGPEFQKRIINQVRSRVLFLHMESLNAELNLQVLKALKAEEALKEQQGLLQRTNQQLAELASRDPLTQLYNRRRGWELMDYEEKRAGRTMRPTGVILIDVDHFKMLNDDFGHDTGDKILSGLAALFTSKIRGHDFAIRWGGEEFLIILPETSAEGAWPVAEKLREAAAETDWALGERRVTLSFGLGVKNAGESWREVLIRVDAALYKAKNAGRNRIQLA